MIFKGYPGGTYVEAIHPVEATRVLPGPRNQLSIRSQIPSGLVSRYTGIQVYRYTGIQVYRLTVNW